jgi:predicted glutamine amidotransferase
MCGIFGFTSPKVKNSAEFYRFANRLFEESAYRGRDASGFAAIGDKTFIADKRALSSRTFIKTSQEWRSLREAQSVSLIGHTRAATAGRPMNNKNNHPFHGPRFSLAHNGGIMGHKDVAADKGIKLQTECDSELLLHYLERRTNIRDGIIEVFSELTAIGYMAVCVLDRATGDIHLFRSDDAPCFIMKVPRWNALIFASTLQILGDAANRVLSKSFKDIVKSIEVPFQGPIPPFHHIRITPEGRIADADLSNHINFTKKYAIARSVGFGAMARIFNGARSNFENGADNESPKDKAAAPAHEMAPSPSRVVRLIEPTKLDGSSTTVDVDAWSCVTCKTPLAGQSCISVEDVDKPDPATKKPMRRLICKKCWNEKSKTAEAPADAVASAKPNKREATRAELISILPDELKKNANPVGVLETMREPVLDHELNDTSASTLMRYHSMDIEQRLQSWSGMTLKRIDEMCDGEYLAYTDFLKQGLVMA